MRIGIILSSMWLGGALALASVQAAEPAPAQANGAVVVTVQQDAGGTPQATVTQQGDAAVAMEGLTVQMRTAAADAQPPAPAPPAAAPGAADPGAPAGPFGPGAQGAPAGAFGAGAPGAANPGTRGGTQRTFDVSSASRRRFQPRGQGQPTGQPTGFSRQGPSVTGAGPAVSPQATPFDAYRVLIERNIFSTVRGVPPRPTGPVGPPPPPARYLVLKGVLGGESGYIAFIEDTRSGETAHHQAGDVVAQGRITAVSRDGITYEQNGKATKLAIGDYVGGAPPAGSAPASAAAPEATTPGSTADIAERMRQKRLKEEGK